MGAFPEVEPQYVALGHDFSAVGLVYLHLVDHSSMGAPVISAEFKPRLRKSFGGTPPSIGPILPPSTRRAKRGTPTIRPGLPRVSWVEANR